MDFGTIIAAVAGLMTNFIAMGKEDEAQRLRDQVAAELGPEILPDLDRAVAASAGQSQFQGLTESPDNRARQLDVDADLADIYDTAGNTQADQAAYDVARRGVSQRAGANAGDAAMAAAQRGQTGSGLQAVLASQGQQDELEALGALNAQIASQGRDRALQALNARAGNASNIRGADYRAGSDRAAAIDLMNRFNASQEQQAGMYNAGIPQQQFNNNLNRLAAQGAAREGAAQGMDRAAAGTRQQGAGIGNAAISFGQSWDWGQDGGRQGSHEDEEDGDH